jgi:hypothetical protein
MVCSPVPARPKKVPLAAASARITAAAILRSAARLCILGSDKTQVFAK